MEQCFWKLSVTLQLTDPVQLHVLLAYLGLSAYEACLGGMPDYQSLQYRLGISDIAVQTNLYWLEVINAFMVI